MLHKNVIILFNRLQDMVVIHLIKDEDVKSNLAQLDHVAQMLNVLQTDEQPFARFVCLQ